MKTKDLNRWIVYLFAGVLLTGMLLNVFGVHSAADNIYCPNSNCNGVLTLRQDSGSDPTCTEQGIMQHYTCSACDALYIFVNDQFVPENETNNIIPPLGHEYVWHNDSTNHWMQCARCDAIDPDHQASPHTYGENGRCTECDHLQQTTQPSNPAPQEPEPQPEPEQVPIVSVGSQEPQVQDGDQGENANVETPIDKAQKLLQSQIILVLSRKQDVINSLKNKGVTLDIGTWESLNKESYEKIDTLLGNGIPVTIKYRYNNQYKEITIPATLKYKLADLCDAKGYLGLENLRGKLIADGYIKVETNDDEEMNIEIIDGIPMPVPKDPPKYEMKKLDVVDPSNKFDRIIGSQNNSNALPGTASLSAAGTTAATSPATSISSDTGSVSGSNYAIAPANTEEWDKSVNLAIAVGIENAKALNTDYTIYVASDGKALALTIKAGSLLYWGNLIKIKDKVKEMVNEKKSITI